MSLGYSRNKSVQILIALMKAHGIKKIVASPGATILELNAGLQLDESFEIFSSVDERSAAYLACGMANESGEIVAITCTEATASRNYYPGITEAYYRKLPILAITGVHRYSKIGHLHSQIIDRSVSPKDSFRFKVHLPVIKDEEDEWETELLVNTAILELKHHGGGPVHIDLPCCGIDYDFTAYALPVVNKITRYCLGDELPSILGKRKIAIYSGYNREFNEGECDVINKFCARFNAVFMADHTSGYHGKYSVFLNLLSLQRKEYDLFKGIDLLIHIGEPAADEVTLNRLKNIGEVWRVSPDGELRDAFGKLTNVFEMSIFSFMNYYLKNAQKDVVINSFYGECKGFLKSICLDEDLLPFSNIYMASKLTSVLPKGSAVHLGLSNTIRAWSVFEMADGVSTVSNVGCRGIDGVLSTAIGASLCNEDRLYFCILGDLSFFYDMNSLGNKHIGNNLRILLINNNGGGVFKHYGTPGHECFGDEFTNQYIAAAGHFGSQSNSLVKHYAKDLGFEYVAVSDKKAFNEIIPQFIDVKLDGKAILVEAFTNDDDEREAFNLLSHLDIDKTIKAKDTIKKILGNSGTEFVKRIISH